MSPSTKSAAVHFRTTFRSPFSAPATSVALCALSIATPNFARAGQPGFAVVSDAPPKAKLSTEFLARLSEVGHVATAEATAKGLAAVGHEGGPSKFLVDSTDEEATSRACKLAERLLGEYSIVLHRASNRSVRLTVVRSSPCSVIFEKEWGGSDDAQLAKRLVEAVVVAIREKPTEEKPVEPTKEDDPVPPDSTPAPAVAPKPEPLPQGDETPVTPMFALELGPRLGLRDFSYHELRSKNLFEFGPGAPSTSLRGRIDVFPFAREKHAGRLFGFGAEGSYSLGGKTTTRASASGSPEAELSTTYATFDVFLEMTAPVAKGVFFGGRAGYGHTSFTFEVPASESRLAPSSTYSHVRVGPRVDGRIGDGALFAEFDYLHVLDAGTAANRFASPSGLGLALMLGGGYFVSKHVEIVGQLSGTRFISFFRPKDGLTATGAIDVFGTIDLSARLLF